MTMIMKFGFPVFVAVWFMWRMEKRIDRILELMTSLMQSTAVLAKSVDTHIDYTRQTGSVRALREDDDK